MNCQKCRTPLKLDGSLQDLNPAAYDLLVGLLSLPLPSPREFADSTSIGSNNHVVTQGLTPSRPPYPQYRKALLSQTSREGDSPIFRRTIPPPRRGIGPQNSVSTQSKDGGSKDNPAMSFVLLTDSQVTPSPGAIQQSDGRIKSQVPQQNGDLLGDSPKPLSSKVDSSARLFEILSARSDIDHPICHECTELLLSSLQARLASSTKERDAYITFLRELKSNVPSAADISKAEADLTAAKASQEKAFAELLDLEAEKAVMEDEIMDLEKESRELDLEEEAFWRERNAFALTLSSFQDTRDALNAAYEHDSQQLERLQRTNVYNDTFCIGHDGDFGTINGLRLGRLSPPKNVEWSEINAAWGTTALLLATVAEKLGFTFRGYRIKPMGSTTHLEKIETSQPPSITNSTSSTQSPSSLVSNSTPRTPSQTKTASLELFSSGDLPLGRTFLHRRFNDAMVAFLVCLRQLGEFVEKGERAHAGQPPSRGLKLPYKIEKDKIGDLSIKLGTSQDESWTNACKYVLTCCKFLLAHASNVANPGAGGRRV